MKDLPHEPSRFHCGRIPFRERLTCTIEEGCAATGLGRTKMYEFIKDNRVATTKVGRRTLIVVATLVAAVGA